VGAFFCKYVQQSEHDLFVSFTKGSSVLLPRMCLKSSLEGSTLEVGWSWSRGLRHLFSVVLFFFLYFEETGKTKIMLDVDQFDPSLNVTDQWTFCATLGPKECKR